MGPNDDVDLPAANCSKMTRRSFGLVEPVKRAVVTLRGQRVDSSSLDAVGPKSQSAPSARLESQPSSWHKGRSPPRLFFRFYISLQESLHVLRTFQVMADFIGHALLRIRQFKGQFTSKLFQALHIIIDRQAVFSAFSLSSVLGSAFGTKELFKITRRFA